MPRFVFDPVPTGELPPDRPIHHDQRDSFGAIVIHVLDGIPHVLVCQGYKGTSFPKGRQEPGETPAQTACREVWEETGISIEVDTEFEAVVPSARPGDKRTVTFFLGRAPAGCVSTNPSEVQYAAWIPVSEAIASIRYPPDRQSLEEAVKYFLQ